jgi:hypothetical protein
MWDSWNFWMHFSTTKLLFSYSFISHSLDYFGARDKHITSILHHENKISKSWWVNCSSSTWTHNQWNLRDDSWGVNISLENFSITCKRFHSFLNTCTTRIIKTDNWCPNKDSFIHYLTNFLRKSFRETSTKNCKILRESKNNFAINCTLSSYNTISIELLFFHSKICTAMSYKLIIFHKWTFIKQKFNSFSCSKFILLMMFINTCLTSSKKSFLAYMIPSL